MRSPERGALSVSRTFPIKMGNRFKTVPIIQVFFSLSLYVKNIIIISSFFSRVRKIIKKK
jgi:hypothetical protein